MLNYQRVTLNITKQINESRKASPEDSFDPFSTSFQPKLSHSQAIGAVPTGRSCLATQLIRHKSQLHRNELAHVHKVLWMTPWSYQEHQNNGDRSAAIIEVYEIHGIQLQMSKKVGSYQRDS